MPDVNPSPRQRFIDYVRRVPGARPVVSPFLPDSGVVAGALGCLGLVAGDDPVANEIRLSRALDYEPMFMTDCTGLIFPWKEDESRSDDEWIVSTIATRKGEWVKRVPRATEEATEQWGGLGEWGDESLFPVQTEADYDKLVLVCDQIQDRDAELRAYFREWRERVGEDGVLVICHPHIGRIAFQAGQRNVIYHYVDYPEAFHRGMEAIFRAACYLFDIAIEMGIDFMSESTYGLELTSLTSWDEVDLPYLRALSNWTHEREGLFWYHNCGYTREMIRSGRLNSFGADVVETIAPPPEGDNDLVESRRHLDPSICSKGNLNLGILRRGNENQVIRETKGIVEAVRGYTHIYSTADAVLAGTPPENLIAFVRTAREESERG